MGEVILVSQWLLFISTQFVKIDVLRIISLFPSSFFLKKISHFFGIALALSFETAFSEMHDERSL